MNFLPPMDSEPGQATLEFSVTPPASSSAPAVIILKVEPAGYAPFSPMSYDSALVCATARISPVDGRSATMLAASVTPPSAD